MPRQKKPFNPYPFQFHQELELEISSITNLGDGVSKHTIKDQDGNDRQWVIFIPYVLLNERVRVRITKNESTCSHAEIVNVLDASPHRRQPKCRYYGSCGGCQYQHVTYQQQLLWKQQQVAELLERLAHITHPVNPTIASPKEWNYRSKITPHFQKPHKGKIGDIGFQKKGTSKALIDIDECLIALESINGVFPAARDSVCLLYTSPSPRDA